MEAGAAVVRPRVERRRVVRVRYCILVVVVGGVDGVRVIDRDVW